MRLLANTEIKQQSLSMQSTNNCKYVYLLHDQLITLLYLFASIDKINTMLQKIHTTVSHAFRELITNVKSK